MGTLGDKLREAGVMDAEARAADADERGRQMARAAWQKWSGSGDAALRRKHVVDALGAAPGSVLITLLDRFRPGLMAEIVGRALVEAEKEIRDAAKAAGGGQDGFDTQTVVAPAKPSGVEPVDRGHVKVGTHAVIAPVPPSSPKLVNDDAGHPGIGTHAVIASIVTPSPHAGASRLSGAANALSTPRAASPSAAPSPDQLRAHAIASVARKLSRLDTVEIDGRPIGDCTAAAVRVWGGRRVVDARHARRDARFAAALTDGLADDAIIRQRWQDADEVDRIFQRAEIDHAA